MEAPLRFRSTFEQLKALLLAVVLLALIPLVAVVGTSSPGAAASDNWRTGERDGRWEIINPQGQIVQWEAVNVRAYDNLDSRYLFPGSWAQVNHDMDQLADRFDYVRLNILWSEMEPTEGRLDRAQANRVLRFLDDAQERGVGVILDAVHLSTAISGTRNGQSDAFGIPAWAWQEAGFGRNSRTKANSYNTWANSDDSSRRLSNYLELLHDGIDGQSLITHDAVVAVEIVNEPHPPTNTNGAATSDAQRRLLVAYRNAIERTRDVTGEEMLFVVGAYYGGTRFGGPVSRSNNRSNGYYDSPTSAGYFQFNHARTEITDKGIDNVVWTAHSYFSGVEAEDRDENWGDYTASDGQEANGARPNTSGNYLRQSPLIWAEGSNAAGCYTQRDLPDSVRSNDWTGQCGDAVNRSEAQEGQAWNAVGSDSYAQAADMPFFMGEWGTTRLRYMGGGSSAYQGWVDGDLLLCDKLQAFEDIDGDGTSISWAVWSFRADTDAFGLYLPKGASRNGPAFEGDGLSRGSYVDAGRFGGGDGRASDGAWAGDDWVFARPLRSAGESGSCRD